MGSCMRTFPVQPLLGCLLGCALRLLLCALAFLQVLAPALGPLLRQPLGRLPLPLVLAELGLPLRPVLRVAVLRVRVVLLEESRIVMCSLIRAVLLGSGER